MNIKIYKLKGKKETFLKEYKTMKGALDYIEDIKNYDYMLLGLKGKQVVIYQGQQQRKNFFEKLVEHFHFIWYNKRKEREKKYVSKRNKND